MYSRIKQKLHGVKDKAFLSYMTTEKKTLFYTKIKAAISPKIIIDPSALTFREELQ